MLELTSLSINGECVPSWTVWCDPRGHFKKWRDTRKKFSGASRWTCPPAIRSGVVTPAPLPATDGW